MCVLIGYAFPFWPVLTKDDAQRNVVAGHYHRWNVPALVYADDVVFGENINITDKTQKLY
jgi:hypothetical protein